MLSNSANRQQVASAKREEMKPADLRRLMWASVVLSIAASVAQLIALVPALAPALAFAAGPGLWLLPVVGAVAWGRTRRAHGESDVMRSRIISCLRWACVVPAGALAAISISFPLHWILMMKFSGVNEDAPLTLGQSSIDSMERLLMAFFGPMAFVYAGAATAPTWKVPTSIALMVLLGGLSSWSATLITQNPQSYFTADPLVSFFALIAGSVAAIWATSAKVASAAGNGLRSAQ